MGWRAGGGCCCSRGCRQSGWGWPCPGCCRHRSRCGDQRPQVLRFTAFHHLCRGTAVATAAFHHLSPPSVVVLQLRAQSASNTSAEERSNIGSLPRRCAGSRPARGSVPRPAQQPGAAEHGHPRGRGPCGCGGGGEGGGGASGELRSAAADGGAQLEGLVLGVDPGVLFDRALRHHFLGAAACPGYPRARTGGWHRAAIGCW